MNNRPLAASFAFFFCSCVMLSLLSISSGTTEWIKMKFSGLVGMVMRSVLSLCVVPFYSLNFCSVPFYSHPNIRRTKNKVFDLFRLSFLVFSPK